MALVKEEWPRPVYLRPGISVLVQIFEETRSNRTKRGRCVPILPRASYELFTYLVADVARYTPLFPRRMETIVENGE